MSAQVYRKLQWDFMGKHWEVYTGYGFISILGVYLQYVLLPEKIAGLTSTLTTRGIGKNETLGSNVWQNILENKSVGGLIVVLVLTYLLISVGDFTERNIEMKFLPEHLRHCRNALFRGLVKRYREEYNDLPSAEVITRINHVSKMFVYQSEYFIGTMFPYLVGLVVVLVYCFRKNKTVGAVIATSLVLSLGSTLYWGVKVADASNRREKVYLDMVDKMNDNIANLMNVYVNNMEGRIVEEHDKLNKGHNVFFRKELALTRNSGFTTSAISILGFGALLVFGFNLVKRKKMKAFDLAAIVTLYIMYTSWSMKVLDGLPYIFRRIGVWIQNIPFVKNILIPTSSETTIAEIQDGTVSVHNLAFKYPSKKDDEIKYVFRNKTFLIKSGERVAIVGRSGSGKSTLMKLMVGLYKPANGIIRVGGADTRKLDKAVLREKVNYVNQRSVLSDDTVFNNIVYGNNASQEEVDRLLDTYDLRVVFSDLSKGVYGDAGVGGGNLSLGMSKTVIVLRGILKNKTTKVYLFDEPVAGLDPSTRRKIMNMITEECRGKTIICVTHLKAIKSFVDRIIEL